LGRRRAVQVSPSDVTRYVEQRRQQGAANATIKRELSALRRAFKLAVRAEKIPRQPSIVALEENNTRQGFFERDQCEAVRTHLPAHLRPVVIFAYITGWRTRSGALTRRWQHVDFKAGTVCLDPGETKNVEGCTCHMTPELRACLEAQWAETQALQRKTGRIIPWVFHHRGGQQIKDDRKSWWTACRLAGVPGRIPHDFRRTAVRNLERALTAHHPKRDGCCIADGAAADRRRATPLGRTRCSNWGLPGRSP
jgi:integrase